MIDEMNLLVSATALSALLTYTGMDWAGFEPATSRLRSMHYYQPELPAPNFAFQC